jgi:hypothetical protein
MGKLKKFFKGKEEPEQAGTNEAAAVDSDLAPRNFSMVWRTLLWWDDLACGP